MASRKASGRVRIFLLPQSHREIEEVLQRAFIGTGHFSRAYRSLTGNARGFIDIQSLSTFLDAAAIHEEIIVLGPLPRGSYGDVLKKNIQAFNRTFGSENTLTVRLEIPEATASLADRVASIQRTLFKDVVIDPRNLISKYESGDRTIDDNRSSILARASELAAMPKDVFQRESLRILNATDQSSRQGILRGVLYCAVAHQNKGSAYFDGPSIFTELLLGMFGSEYTYKTPAAQVSEIVNSVWRMHLGSHDLCEEKPLRCMPLSSTLFFLSIQNAVLHRDLQIPSYQPPTQEEVANALSTYRKFYAPIRKWSKKVQFSSIGASRAPRTRGKLGRARSETKDYARKALRSTDLEDWAVKFENYARKHEGTTEVAWDDEVELTGKLSVSLALAGTSYLVRSLTGLRRALRKIIKGAKQGSDSNIPFGIALQISGLNPDRKPGRDATAYNVLRHRITKDVLNH